MAISLEAANALEDAIDRKVAKAASKRTTTSGKVTRVDKDGTVYVTLAGSSVETPASASAAQAKPGDEVSATVDGGKLTIDGNRTDPAPGVSAVNSVRETANQAVADAARAASSAASAQVSADAAEAEAARAATSASTGSAPPCPRGRSA